MEYAPAIVSLEGLDALIARLRETGHEVLGPVARDGAIVYDELAGLEDLPRGWRDRQEPGRYRLERTDSPALFGFNLGPQGCKRVFHAPEIRLEAEPATGAGRGARRPVALLGVRPCELAAIDIQDRVLLGGAYPDPHYAARREGAIVIAVNCTTAAGTCFCVGLGTGPRARAGHDLALTELVDGDGHRFLVEPGSERGGALLQEIPHAPATEAARAVALARSRRVAESMSRRLPPGDLRGRILERLESPRWEAVAERCLACGNCTQVCPTCFCTTVEDREDLVTGRTWRVLRWGSCFDDDFSYLHGGRVRPDIASRYRQWFVHKLATWHDQFGTPGCVGCGRCIAWCPVGIDITAEAATLTED
jgi:ferredoxin